MERQHIWAISRVERNSFAVALLLVAGLACANAARAQTEPLNLSRAADADPIDSIGLQAHIAALPSAPVAKLKPVTSGIVQTQSQIQATTDRGHPLNWLDRSALTYGLVQGGAEIFDGATTRYFIHHCSHCVENDPVSRLLLGAHPSWGKMVPMGIAEVAVSTYSYQRMKNSPHRFARVAAPLLPMGLTAVHMIEGARNITLKNKYRCANPGYVVVGAVCVPAQPIALDGSSDPSGTGPGSHRDLK